MKTDMECWAAEAEARTALANPKPWKPEPGDVTFGWIVRVDALTGKYGRFHVATLLTPAGAALSVKLSKGVCYVIGESLGIKAPEAVPAALETGTAVFLRFEGVATSASTGFHFARYSGRATPTAADGWPRPEGAAADKLGALLAPTSTAPKRIAPGEVR